MKVFDWTSESGVNYAVVVDSIKSLTTRYAAPTTTSDTPGVANNTYVAIDTDDGRYVAFTDQVGYAWLQMPHKPTETPTYLVITTSINRFVDKVYEADKQIRLAATPV